MSTIREKDEKCLKSWNIVNKCENTVHRVHFKTKLAYHNKTKSMHLSRKHPEE